MPLLPLKRTVSEESKPIEKESISCCMRSVSTLHMIPLSNGFDMFETPLCNFNMWYFYDMAVPHACYFFESGKFALKFEI